jgi:hypothetical protein
MRIEIISGVCLGDGVDGEVGQNYEVPDYLGKNLVLRGKARVYDPTPSGKPLEDMKAGELLAYAASNSLGLDSMRAQEGAVKILAAVQDALQKRGAFTQDALNASAKAAVS